MQKIIIIMLQYIRYLNYYLKVTLLVSGIYIFGILEILLIFSFICFSVNDIHDGLFTGFNF